MSPFVTFLIGFLADALILIGMGVLVDRKEGVRFWKLVAGSLVVAAGYAALTAFGHVLLWLLGYLFAIVPAAAAGAVLKIYGRLRLKQAAIGALISFGLHFVIGWVLTWI
ncbi:MAG: hypothetical protein ACYTG0_13625 [Planctomycetota bacterium]|jgi:hypothetical protein